MWRRRNSVKFPTPKTADGCRWQEWGSNLTENQIQPMMPKLAAHTGAQRVQRRRSLMALAELSTEQSHLRDPLLTAEDVAERLKVSKDWVWDHSSRRLPYLPVIRMSDGALRYRTSQIEAFLGERERASVLRRKRR